MLVALQSLIILLVFTPSPSLSGITEKIVLDEFGRFVDSRGRLMLFHGYNTVQKGPPFYDPQALNQTRLDLYEEWGFNVVRLGVIWHAAMPQRGVFNETYLNVISQLIDQFSERNIYVLLDMHQDVISSRFGTYDAIPNWLLDSFSQPPKMIDFPWPLSQRPTGEDWFKGYLTYACEHAYQELYSNTSGAWIYWGDYWAELAKRFGNNPAIIGYELINEPFAGNVYTNPLRVLPGYAGKHNLLPVYDYLVKRIRAVDKTTLIFYEPVTWGVFFPPVKEWMGTGFDRVPGSLEDPSESSRSVLSYHYYCWALQTADPTETMPVWKQLLCDDVLMKQVFANSYKAIQKSGGGRFLTEFGLCAPDDSPISINTVECNTVMNMADMFMQSWTYWDAMFFDADGKPIETQIRSFGRTYPKATRGNPVKLQFDPKTSKFFYSFISLPISSEEAVNDVVIAEIFVPMKIHYPNGLTVYTEPTEIGSYLVNNTLFVSAPSEGFKEMTNVLVQIVPK